MFYFWNNKNLLQKCILFLLCRFYRNIRFFIFYKDIFFTSDSQIQMDHRNKKPTFMESCLIATSNQERLNVVISLPAISNPQPACRKGKQ